MATEDQAPNPDQGEGEPDGKDDDARDWKSEAYESRKRRDNALKRAQQAEGKIRSYEERLAEQQKELDELREAIDGKKPAGTSNEDSEELKRQFLQFKEKAKNEKQELLQQLDRERNERKEITIREAVIKAAADLVLNPEAFYKLTRDQYHVEETDQGKTQIVSKSGATLQEFIQESLDDPEYSWMSKKQRRGGMGVNQSESATTEKKMDVERLLATGGNTKEAFEKNPDLARQFLQKARLTT